MTTFKAYQVSETEDNQFDAKIIDRTVTDLPEGEVLVRVKYSSLNFKDALSASGNRGVTRQYPHTPGIDAAGIVESSVSDKFKPGDSVIVIGYDLGMNTAGGFGQYIRVPANWVVPCPDGLGLRESMILGTAGFTAALCVEKLQLNGVLPINGTVLVTGATGGVGVVAVAILHKLGYKVAASTGKKTAYDMLQKLGAGEIVDRQVLATESPKPLAKEQWAGAVDVVGGDTLANLLKSIQYGGSVACCGLVQSTTLNTTVLPFILRGVNLLGIDSVQLPLATKSRLWQKLASEWKIDTLDSMCHEIGLTDLKAALGTVLKGGASGRYVLNLDR